MLTECHGGADRLHAVDHACRHADRLSLCQDDLLTATTVQKRVAPEEDIPSLLPHEAIPQFHVVGGWTNNVEFLGSFGKEIQYRGSAKVYMP